MNELFDRTFEELNNQNLLEKHVYEVLWLISFQIQS